MTEFISIEILSTMAGCSVVITLLTQIFKQYLSNRIDTKWLALIFSILIGTLRIVYIGVYDFDNIVSGILNIFVLLASSIGIYEVSKSIGGDKK